MGELIIKLLIHYLELTAPLLFWPGLVYLLMLFFSRWVLKNQFENPIPSLITHFPKVTIIVVARNEAAQIKRLLEAIIAQDYAGVIEALIIDDSSTDGTAALVSQFEGAGIKLKRYPAPPAGMSPKKWAITNAVQEAAGEIIITTDADCVPTKTWVASMVSSLLANKEKKMIMGPVVLNTKGRLLDDLQAQQFGAVMAISFAFAEKGFPFSGSAANLAYYKKDFIAVGGYSGNTQKSGGDDVFLIERFNLSYPNSVGVCSNEKACISTSTQNTWIGFAQQSVRWASKTGSYKNKLVIFLAIGLLIYHFAFVIQGILASIITVGAILIADAKTLSIWLNNIYGRDTDIEQLNSQPIYNTLMWVGFIFTIWGTFLWMWIIRVYAESKLLNTWFSKFQNEGNPQNKVALNSIIYSFYVLFIGFHSLFKPKVNWKGRKTN